MIAQVTFLSRHAAENMSGKEGSAIISISEPDFNLGQANLMHGWHAIHRTEFHDIDVWRPNESLTLMSSKHAEDIVEFVYSVASDIDHLVVHCTAGISRSAGVAKWIADTFNLPFNHQYALYNRHVYRLLIDANQRRQETPPQ